MFNLWSDEKDKIKPDDLTERLRTIKYDIEEDMLAIKTFCCEETGYKLVEILVRALTGEDVDASKFDVLWNNIHVRELQQNICEARDLAAAYKRVEKRFRNRLFKGKNCQTTFSKGYNGWLKTLRAIKLIVIDSKEAYYQARKYSDLIFIDKKIGDEEFNKVWSGIDLRSHLCIQEILVPLESRWLVLCKKFEAIANYENEVPSTLH